MKNPLLKIGIIATSLAIILSATSYAAVPFFTDLEHLQNTNPLLVEGYKKIRIIDAWDIIRQSAVPLAPTTFGIMDTGVDLANGRHPEFIGVNFGSSEPLTFIDTAPAADHPSGHGTAVAGIIGANNISSNFILPSDSSQMNGIMSGATTNYSFELRPLSALRSSFFGIFVSSKFAKHIDTLPDGAIVNLSFAYNNCAATSTSCVSSSEFSAFTDYYREEMAARSDLLFVIAAGNEGINAQFTTPANVNLFNTITVGATETNDERAVFNQNESSNFGANVNIAAPGKEIYAPAIRGKGFLPFSGTDALNYSVFSGTSFAAPFVTGVAGLLKAIKPLLTPAEIKDILTRSADPINTDQPLGSGCFSPSTPQGHTGCRLNALRAVKLALAEPAPILRQFNTPVQGNGRGMVFDGTNLYYSNIGDTRIFKINTQGQLLQTIQTSPPIALRSLAFDGTLLWVGSTNGRFFTVNRITGARTLRFTFTYPIGDSCFFPDQVSGSTDGFEYDPFTNTFWISDDGGKTVYNVTTTGGTLSSFSVAPECNTGIAVLGGNTLGLILYDAPDPDHTFETVHARIVTKTGANIPNTPELSLDSRLYEDAAFDSATFAPQCALWTIQDFLPAPPMKVTAFKVGCN